MIFSTLPRDTMRVGIRLVFLTSRCAATFVTDVQALPHAETDSDHAPYHVAHSRARPVPGCAPGPTAPHPSPALVRPRPLAVHKLRDPVSGRQFCAQLSRSFPDGELTPSLSTCVQLVCRLSTLLSLQSLLGALGMRMSFANLPWLAKPLTRPLSARRMMPMRPSTSTIVQWCGASRLLGGMSRLGTCYGLQMLMMLSLFGDARRLGRWFSSHKACASGPYVPIVLRKPASLLTVLNQF